MLPAVLEVGREVGVLALPVPELAMVASPVPPWVPVGVPPSSPQAEDMATHDREMSWMTRV